jgi:hypothetical protein
MDSKIKEFLHKVSDKISEIDDMVKEYGYENEFVSCSVIGIISGTKDDEFPLLNSVYSICIESDEELDRMLEVIVENYNKVKKDNNSKQSGLDELFGGDINLN